jgi:hypothetical protein
LGECEKEGVGEVLIEVIFLFYGIAVIRV